MLKQLSRLKRTRSIVIIGFALIIAGSLIVFYAPGRNSATVAPLQSAETLATVNGEDISVADLARYKDNFQKRLGGQFNLGQFGSDRRFLDTLIQRRIVSQEAARLGLAASDQEVADEIRKQFKDPGGQFVGFDRYKEIVAANYGDLQAFERELRDDIARRKLSAFVTAGVRVAPAEVEDDYKRKNTSFNVVYVPVAADKLAQKIQPSDAELRAYFDSHKPEYRITVPQKKIRYLFIEQAKSGEKLNFSDDEIRKAYDGLLPENRQAGVRVQQIVLKVARPDLDAQVKEKADNLVAQARGDAGNISEEKFAELAKGNSEDANTAKNGGAIPNVIRRNPSKPDDPLQQTIDMQEGAVTEPIKFSNAYFIFRRGKPVDKTFEEAKNELVVSMRNRDAYGVARDVATKAAEALKQSKDFPKVAQQFATQANMAAATMVKETGYVKPGDDVKDIGVSQEFEGAVAALNNVNDLGGPVPVKGGFAVPMLLEKREPRDADFEDVKDQVSAAVKNEQARARLEQVARDIASSSGNASGLKAAAEKHGLEAKTSDNYKLGSPLDTTGANPIGGGMGSTDDAVYGLKEGEVTKSPVKTGETWMVIGVTKRTDADTKEFDKQRETLTQTMLDTRRNQVFDDYITNVQANMSRQGKIKINSDALAKMAADAPAAAPQGMPPGFPGGQGGLPQGFPPPQ
jgi:peptidyl-prolyl cis-trans isomerase D